MLLNKITINKIIIAFEIVCSLFKKNLITEALIVGSVAKGTARSDSDIDIYLINPEFKKQKYTHDIHLISNIDVIDKSNDENIYINKIINFLKEFGVDFKYLPSKHEMLWYAIYKDEIIHFMYDYESESIRKGGVYIELTKELCDEVN